MDLIVEGFYAIVNFLINGLVVAITWLLGLLPDTPFRFEAIQWGDFGKLIGAIIPVAKVFTHFTLILGAFLLYYAIRWVLRIIRMIQ
ncbi:hypothetical protein [Bacillus thuringiensis]|uniref:hypothetical protein n=1 Tax=Bacillus thuringiensis TaxID=1428 RepID=UPI00301B1878